MRVLTRKLHRLKQTQRTATEILGDLKRFTQVKDLENGRRIHEEALASGLQKNKYVAAALITLYRKCRQMAFAREVFDKLERKDAATWNSLILGYVENGNSALALDLFFNSMSSEPDYVTYLAAIKACTALASSNASEKQTCLGKGVTLHGQARNRGLDTVLAVANTLVDMYGKCGDMYRAEEVFSQISQRNVVSWNCLIMGYVENGQSSKALETFTSMDCEPDSVSYIAALKACTGLVELEGKQISFRKGADIHREITERGLLSSNVILASTLIDMYSKCGSMERAREVFNGTSHRNAVTWTCIILGYVENGESSEALELFNSMDCEPDSVAFLAALKACGNVASEKGRREREVYLRKGIDLHKRVDNGSYGSATVISNALICMYGRCGSLRRARDVFDGMSARKDVVSWTSLPRARDVFDGMSSRKDVVSWTSLMVACVENGDSAGALDLHSRMDCQPNSVTFLVALRACASLVSERGADTQAILEKGVSLHQKVKESGFDSDTQVMNALLDMYTRCGAMERALQLFNSMSTRNSFSYVTALKACAGSTDLNTGRSIHARVCELGLEGDQAVATALVDLYSKCGLMKHAEHTFDGLADSGCTVSWTAFMSGFSSLGDSGRVFDLAGRMQESGVEMNSVTFVCILTACSHGGVVDKGRKYFHLMVEGYGITPGAEHYNCMVDILGRANQLEEALSFVKSMPPKVIDHVTWVTLLSACNKWRNFKVGKAAFDALAATRNADSGAPYLLMAHIYRNHSTII